MDEFQSRNAVFVGGTPLGSSLSISVPTDPPPMTTRLRALFGGVDSLEDRNGQRKIFSEARVFPPSAKRALETQGAYSDDSEQAAFLPPTSFVRPMLKFQRKLDMSQREEHQAVFLPLTFAELECELLPVASTCSPDCSRVVMQDGRDQTILLEARSGGSSASFNVESFADLLWSCEAGSRVKALGLLTNEPLVGRIRHAPFSPRWSTLAFPRFKRDGDPDLYLLEFWTLMDPNDSEDQLARIFKQSLKGQALRWYYRLEPGLIDSFETLSREFVSRYSFNRTQPKQLDTLFDMRMGRTEILKDFVIHFRSEVTEIEGAAQNEKIACMAFIRAILEGHPLREDLLCRPARSLEDLYKKAEKQIWVEVNDSRLRRVAVIAESDLRSGGLPWWDKASAACTFFKVSHEKIYEAIKGEPYFQCSNSRAVRQEGADSRRFYHYHNAKGHRMRNCRSFNELLRKLVSEE